MSAPDLQDLVRRHSRLVALGGLALLLLGTALASAAYHAPVEERTTTRHDAWTERASTTYSVTVTRNSTHWPVGTILPMGQPAYFRTVSDAIQFDHAWAAEAPDARGVAAGTMIAQVRATSADGRQFWSIERTLAEATTSDVAQGLTLSGRLDLDPLVEEVAAVSRELPVGDGTVNWSIRTTVVYAIETGDRREQGTSERVVPILASDPRFILPAPEALAWSEAHGEDAVTIQSHAAGIPGVLGSVRSLALLAVGLAGLVTGAVAGRAAFRDEGFDRERRKYRDWVSVADAVPASARDERNTVDVGSLEDLVHVAADARTRVLLDQGTRVFYALLPGVTYRYARHAKPQ